MYLVVVLMADRKCLFWGASLLITRVVSCLSHRRRNDKRARQKAREVDRLYHIMTDLDPVPALFKNKAYVMIHNIN